jgi:hypothetical protein
MSIFFGILTFEKKNKLEKKLSWSRQEISEKKWHLPLRRQVTTMERKI